MPEPEYREGYPDLLFEGFRLRFGQIRAVFCNAKMQANAGLCDHAILHMQGAAATIFFISYPGLSALIEKRKSDGHNYLFLEDVLAQWPQYSIPSHLQNRVGDE